jgi:hypothetical protein
MLDNGTPVAVRDGERRRTDSTGMRSLSVRTNLVSDRVPE